MRRIIIIYFYEIVEFDDAVVLPLLARNIMGMPHSSGVNCDAVNDAFVRLLSSGLAWTPWSWKMVALGVFTGCHESFENGV